MEKKKRPCQVKGEWINNPNDCTGFMQKEFKGLFHQWANESQVINENGQKKIHSVSNTVGIVEDENGQIHMIKPEDIIFTDK